MIQRLVAVMVGVVVAVTTLATPARPGADHGPHTPHPSVAQRTTTVLPFGDSFTSGADSTDGMGYRSALAQLRPDVRYVGTQGADPWRHEGHSGYTTLQLMDVPVTPAAYALVHVGTNDDGQGATADEMVTRARALVDRLLAGGVGVVILAQIPRTPVNTEWQQQQEDLYDEALPGLAADYGGKLRIVDMRMVPINERGVHPTQQGYWIMAQNWAAALPH